VISRVLFSHLAMVSRNRSNGSRIRVSSDTISMMSISLEFEPKEFTSLDIMMQCKPQSYMMFVYN
jgi:hypothetical protein